jgi:hypothetical protein
LFHGAAADAQAPRPKAAAPPQPDFLVPLRQRLASRDETGARHRDFPDLAVGRDGTVWILAVEHDGTADTVVLFRQDGETLVPAATVSAPGVAHQPALAADGAGGVWCFWGHLRPDNHVVSLRARRFADGALGPETELAASPDAGHSFADAAADGSGGVWVTWQELLPGRSRVWARRWNPADGVWSDPVAVSDPDVPGGNWEPRVACPGDDPGAAWIAYDTSAAGNFDLRLARVSADRTVRRHVLTDGDEYEARASLCADGRGGLWVAAERGRRQWGLDSRGHENALGFNAAKRLLLGRFDLASARFTEVPVPEKGRPTPSPDPTPGAAVNVPSVQWRDGEVWIAYRSFAQVFWRGAILRHRPDTGAWQEPLALPDSTMGQDRHQELTLGPDGALWVAWPSDLRASKACGTAGIFAAALDLSAPFPGEPLEVAPEPEIARAPEPEPYLAEPTPPRSRDDHHLWTVGGKTYRLCWGDLHRHTDISNCRTGFDGCILEAYRYAYDLAGLDFLGTSDHTDIGKVYHPYEWWHTQRHVDVFHAPGRFASLYAYEREQRFPWGHRNIVFARRGGPILHINRQTYRNSPWQATLPVSPGVGEIEPGEVWDLLKRHGQPVAIISHTGATGMGTDWTRYASIDNTHENLVEIFQGARVSYEAVGAPQPTVGLRAGEPYTPSNRAGKEFPLPPAPIPDFEAGAKAAPGFNRGTYQTALAQGHRLGVFASSDHISTHTSFGGVYVDVDAGAFTREGILEGFNARRTCAATDKIFVEFRCGDRLMGEAFALPGPPALDLRVLGTAPIRRITVVRNEQDRHRFEPDPATSSFAATWTDDRPAAGENRYYLRIEQADGNMAWSSPLWIRVGDGK